MSVLGDIVSKALCLDAALDFLGAGSSFFSECEQSVVVVTISTLTGLVEHHGLVEVVESVRLKIRHAERGICHP